MRTTWRCKDGFVNFQLSGGAAALPSIHALVNWMEESGLGDPRIHEVDWPSLRYGNLTREMMAVVEPPIERFLLSRSKAELTRGALERRILLFPVNSARDILETEHLHARQYFQPVDHPELGPHSVDTPEFRLSRTPFRIRWSAPLLGQHTEHVCREIVGMSEAEYRELKAEGVLE